MIFMKLVEILKIFHYIQIGNGVQAIEELNKRNRLSEQELLDYVCENDQLVDWQHIRNIATDVAPWRTAEDLRRQWDHHLRPDVNHSSRWTKEENQELIRLVGLVDTDAGVSVDWHAIAKALGT